MSAPKSKGNSVRKTTPVYPWRGSLDSEINATLREIQEYGSPSSVQVCENNHNRTTSLSPAEGNRSIRKNADGSGDPPFQMIHEGQATYDGTNESRASLDDLIAELISVSEDQEAREVSPEKHLGECAAEELLHTDLMTGLTLVEILARRRTYGLNQLPEEKTSHLKKLLMHFVGPIQFAMEAAAILALALRKWIDFGIICGLLLLNAVVGFVQDYQAGSVVEELKKTLTNQCNVLREGQALRIDYTHLVPGDVVLLEEGANIPADGRLQLISEQHIQVDQSAVTGESMAVSKTLNDIVYQSSIIRRGEGRMVVIATGPRTFIGRSASLVQEASAGTNRFCLVINQIGTGLLGLVGLALLVVFVSGLARGMAPMSMLEYAFLIVVVGVPVGLPAVVTTTMAVGASNLAKKKAIVKRLSAIEALAGVEILCTDKTGTLTKNKLSLDKPHLMKSVNPNELVLTACLTCSQKAKGVDPVDKAFLKSLKVYMPAARSFSKFQILDFTPFNPVSKKAISVVEAPNGDRITCVKGAPTAVLRMICDETIVDPPVIQEFKSVVENFALRGFRSIAVARKRECEPWQILGLMPCLDPPRVDAEATIREARELGIQVKMLTGDALGIAVEMSRRLGLGVNIFTSETFGSRGGDVLASLPTLEFVEAADGFAEVYPEHKYTVVEVLQSGGYLVAMTGDGVNDAPALKRADTGIAVEGASNTARSAADIVLLTPGLSAIIDAIKISRQIFHRIHAYMTYRIALSIHLLVFLGLEMAMLDESIDTKLVIFLAIFADIATLAIAYDKAPFSQSPVKWNLLRLWTRSMILGSILAAATWMLFYLTTRKSWPGSPQSQGQNSALLFLQIALSGNWTIFLTRRIGDGRGGGRQRTKTTVMTPTSTTNTRFSSLPSWQLVGAVLIIDLLATLLAFFNWFAKGAGAEREIARPSVIQIIEIWVYSAFVLLVMGIVLWLLQAFEMSKFGRRGGGGGGDSGGWRKNKEREKSKGGQSCG